MLGTGEHYFHEAHHIAQPLGFPCRTVFCNLEYDIEHPPDVLEIEGVRWVRDDPGTVRLSEGV